MKKQQIFISFCFLVILFSWIIWAITYTSVCSGLFTWTIYFLPLLFSLVCEYYGRKFFTMTMLLLPPLSVLFELKFAYNTSLVDVINKEGFKLCFNNMGMSGVIVLAIVIPVFFTLVNMFVVSKLRKK